MLLRWRYTHGTGGSPPAPAPPAFPYLVSVRRRCVERLSHCRYACLLGFQLSSSDQHRGWLICRVPTLSWEVCASKLNDWFQGRVPHSWMLALCVLTFGSNLIVCWSNKHYRLFIWSQWGAIRQRMISMFMFLWLIFKMIFKKYT